MSTPVNCGTSFCSCIECVLPDREELEKAVAEAWRAYDIADAALMAYYKGEHMSDNTTQHTTFNPVSYTAPVYSGCWNIGGAEGMRICLVKRPNWFHQKMTYIFFGWNWTDSKENT